jgi:hypothetical protein
MPVAAAKRKRSTKSSVPNSGRDSLGLWIDPSRLPKAKTYFPPPEQSPDDSLINRYLELADLVLNEQPKPGKKKIA